MMLLLLDWDETLTTKDTLSFIAPSSPPRPSSSLPSSPRFSTLSKFYMEDLKAHNEDRQTPTTLRDQLMYLNSIDEVELKSQERVERSGLFKGYPVEILKERAESEDLIFRDGWSSKAKDQHRLSASEWIQNKSKGGSLGVYIISVGWSARFIRFGLSSKKGGSFPSDIPKSIIANEIQIDKDGKGTGKMTKSNELGSDRFEKTNVSEEEEEEGSEEQTGLLRIQSEPQLSGIRTGIHKLRELKRLRKESTISLKERGNENEELITIYVGDSNTDLPCLLAADTGIIIGESISLIETLKSLNLEIYLSNGVEEWKSKKSKQVKVNHDQSKSTTLETDEKEAREEEETWEEVLVKERKSRNLEKGGFDLVKVKDWWEALEVLKIQAGE